MIRNTLIKAFFFLQGKDAIYRYICLSLLYNELFNIRKITEEKKKLMLTFGIKYHFHMIIA